MPTVAVDFDLKKLERELDDVAKKQIPFATAGALTSTAFEGRSSLVDEAKDSFTLRSTYLTRQFRVIKATKRKLYAIIGSLYGPLIDHIEGNVRTGKGERTIPTSNIRPDFSRRVTKAKRPKALLKKSGQRKPFFATFDSGRTVLAQRKAKERLPLKVLYHFPSQVIIEKRFEFERVLERTVDDWWEIKFIESFERAVRTAK